MTDYKLPEDKQKIDVWIHNWQYELEQMDYDGIIRRKLQTPSVPVSIADALAEALELSKQHDNSNFFGQYSDRNERKSYKGVTTARKKALANYNKFKQGETK